MRQVEKQETEGGLRGSAKWALAALLKAAGAKWVPTQAPGAGERREFVSPARPAVKPREIAAGVYCLRTWGANVYLVKSGSAWALIDTGMRNHGSLIRDAAQTVFGTNVPPAAILLTHAHQDHYGSAAQLARSWRLPVYVHADDIPMLKGGVLGVLPDEVLPPVGRLFNRLRRGVRGRPVPNTKPSEFADLASALPDPPAPVPGLPDWELIPTPGHTVGHVAFFRPTDRVLIAGDAVLTAPLAGLIPQLKRISSPLRLPTWNWRFAKASVAKLALLDPLVLASGHGTPLTGPDVARMLRAFSDRFSSSLGV